MRQRNRAIKAMLVLSAGMLPAFGEGCTRSIQQEMEVLFRPHASPTLLHDSWLVDTFGAQILGLFTH